MIRVTQHTARRGGRPCCVCDTEIRPGDRYLERIGMDTDLFDTSFVRDLAHDFCAEGPSWEVTGRTTRYEGDPACDYVREHYQLDVRRGSRVLAGGKPGAVRGGTHHVYVRLDGERHAFPWHPGDVTPIQANASVAA